MFSLSNEPRPMSRNLKMLCMLDVSKETRRNAFTTPGLGIVDTAFSRPIFPNRFFFLGQERNSAKPI